VSDGLRQRGWQVPAYTMPPNREDLAVLRIVVRNGFSHDLAAMLLEDLKRVVEKLDEQAPMHAEQRGAFSH
jgi:glutamate decarboxylase